MNLDTDGLEYRKWGGTQFCKSGDWIVNNDGDVYTVSEASFSATYAPLPDRPGCYYKTATVWAEPAIENGEIETREGKTRYRPGDYLVYNEADRQDGYAVDKHEFESMYEAVDEGE